MKSIIAISVFSLILSSLSAQENWDPKINSKLSEVLVSHKEFVSIPNLPADKQKMYENIDWYKRIGYSEFKRKTVDGFERVYFIKEL